MQLSDSDAEKLKARDYDWVTLSGLLARAHVRVPAVVAELPNYAALVIEDYGDVMLEGRVYELAEVGDFEGVRRLYRDCAAIIGQMLAIGHQEDAIWCSRSFDFDRYVWELQFFAQKYLQAVAEITLSSDAQESFARDVDALAHALSGLSHSFVHRDFHSRNVMVQNGQLAIIDFQDARLGAAAYDLVSLYFDSYVPLSNNQRLLLLHEGIAVVSKALNEQKVKEVSTWWKPVLLQRQLKAIGSFGFLTNDKKRGNYLKYVGPALKTLEESDVFDSRWPFISGELLSLMRQRLT